MFAHERFRRISKLLSQKRRLSVQELQKILKTSPATLRRDLSEMEKAELVFRVHGGIVHPKFLHGEPSFIQRKETSAKGKQEIAIRAITLVPEQSTLFLDSGTTCFEIGRRLITRPDLTIMTNSVSLLQISDSVGAKIIALGGEVRSVSLALVGSLTLSWLEHLRADLAFIGASGLSENEGASTTELGECAVKQAFCKRASLKILVADGQKWNKPAPVHFANWKDFQYWVTTDEISSIASQQVQALGPKVIRCKP
jgi:DeoR/GlpR family transcriptional regulator of sugar metabolism